MKTHRASTWKTLLLALLVGVTLSAAPAVTGGPGQCNQIEDSDSSANQE